MKKTVKLFALLLCFFSIFYTSITAIDSDSSQIYTYYPNYDSIWSTTGYLFNTYSEGVYTIINKDAVLHTTTNPTGLYSEDIFSTYDADSNEISFINLNGTSFVLDNLRNCEYFLGGKCSVISTDGGYGLINTSGEYLLECEYDYIQYDESDTFFVLQETTWQLARLENGVVYIQPFAVDNICDPRKDSTLKNIIASDGRYYGILTADNKPLVDFKYETIYDLTNGLYAGIAEDKTELISADGTVTASLNGEILGSHSEGKIPCRMGDQFGYINRDGKIVTEVTVSDVGMIYPFYEGLAVIQFTDGGYTFINEYGDYACDYVWDYAGQFARGYALVMEAVFDGKESVRQWKIIDHDFNVVEQLTTDVYMSDIDDHSTDFTNGYIRTIDYGTGKMGFAYTENTYPIYDCQTDGHVKGERFDIESPEPTWENNYVACIKCGQIVETEYVPLGVTPTLGSHVWDFITNIAFELSMTPQLFVSIVSGVLVLVIVLVVVYIRKHPSARARYRARMKARKKASKNENKHK